MKFEWIDAESPSPIPERRLSLIRHPQSGPFDATPFDVRPLDGPERGDQIGGLAWHAAVPTPGLDIGG